MAMNNSTMPLPSLQSSGKDTSLTTGASPTESVDSTSSSSQGNHLTTHTTPDLSNESTFESKQTGCSSNTKDAHTAQTTSSAPSREMITPVTNLEPSDRSKTRPAVVDEGYNSDYEIRDLGTSDIDQAAYTLAQAFEHDEMAKYFTYTPDRKYDDQQLWKVHLFIMKCIVRAHVRNGLAQAIGKNYDCVALWMPPGTNLDGWWPSISSGVNRFNFSRMLSKEGRARFFDEFLAKLHTEKHAVLGEHDNNSWYLVYIGTKPGRTGKGYASKLIEAQTKQADADGVPCYLESSNVKNQSLYERMGFVHRTYIDFTRGKPTVTLDVMTREAKAKTTSPALRVKDVGIQTSTPSS